LLPRLDAGSIPASSTKNSDLTSEFFISVNFTFIPDAIINQSKPNPVLYPDLRLI